MSEALKKMDTAQTGSADVDGECNKGPCDTECDTGNSVHGMDSAKPTGHSKIMPDDFEKPKVCQEDNDIRINMCNTKNVDINFTQKAEKEVICSSLVAVSDKEEIELGNVESKESVKSVHSENVTHSITISSSDLSQKDRHKSGDNFHVTVSRNIQESKAISKLDGSVREASDEDGCPEFPPGESSLPTVDTEFIRISSPRSDQQSQKVVCQDLLSRQPMNKGADGGLPSYSPSFQGKDKGDNGNIKKRDLYRENGDTGNCEVKTKQESRRSRKESSADNSNNRVNDQSSLESPGRRLRNRVRQRASILDALSRIPHSDFTLTSEFIHFGFKPPIGLQTCPSPSSSSPMSQPSRVQPARSCVMDATSAHVQGRRRVTYRKQEKRNQLKLKQNLRKGIRAVMKRKLLKTAKSVISDSKSSSRLIQRAKSVKTIESVISDSRSSVGLIQQAKSVKTAKPVISDSKSSASLIYRANSVKPAKPVISDSKSSASLIQRTAAMIREHRNTRFRPIESSSIQPTAESQEVMTVRPRETKDKNPTQLSSVNSKEPRNATHKLKQADANSTQLVTKLNKLVDTAKSKQPKKKDSNSVDNINSTDSIAANATDSFRKTKPDNVQDTNSNIYEKYKHLTPAQVAHLQDMWANASSRRWRRERAREKYHRLKKNRNRNTQGKQTSHEKHKLKMNQTGNEAEAGVEGHTANKLKELASIIKQKRNSTKRLKDTPGNFYTKSKNIYQKNPPPGQRKVSGTHSKSAFSLTQTINSWESRNHVSLVGLGNTTSFGQNWEEVESAPLEVSNDSRVGSPEIELDVDQYSENEDLEHGYSPEPFENVNLVHSTQPLPANVQPRKLPIFQQQLPNPSPGPIAVLYYNPEAAMLHHCSEHHSCCQLSAATAKVTKVDSWTQWDDQDVPHEPQAQSQSNPDSMYKSQSNGLNYITTLFDQDGTPYTIVGQNLSSTTTLQWNTNPAMISSATTPQQNTNPAMISSATTPQQNTNQAMISSATTPQQNTNQAMISSATTPQQNTNQAMISSATTPQQNTNQAMISSVTIPQQNTNPAMVSSATTPQWRNANPAMISSATTPQWRNANPAMISSATTQQQNTNQAMISSATTPQQNTNQAMISSATTQQQNTNQAMISSATTPQQNTNQAMISSVTIPQQNTNPAMISSATIPQWRNANPAMISSATTQQQNTNQAMISSATTQQQNTNQAMISSATTPQQNTNQAMISSATTQQQNTNQAMISSATTPQWRNANPAMISSATTPKWRNANPAMILISSALAPQQHINKVMISSATKPQQNANRVMISATTTPQQNVNQAIISLATTPRQTVRNQPPSNALNLNFNQISSAQNYPQGSLASTGPSQASLPQKPPGVRLTNACLPSSHSASSSKSDGPLPVAAPSTSSLSMSLTTNTTTSVNTPPSPKTVVQVDAQKFNYGPFNIPNSHLLSIKSGKSHHRLDNALFAIQGGRLWAKPFKRNRDEWSMIDTDKYAVVTNTLRGTTFLMLKVLKGSELTMCNVILELPGLPSHPTVISLPSTNAATTNDAVA